MALWVDEPTGMGKGAVGREQRPHWTLKSLASCSGHIFLSQSTSPGVYKL